jgi:hypothetical protein
MVQPLRRKELLERLVRLRLLMEVLQKEEEDQEELLMEEGQGKKEDLPYLEVPEEAPEVM